LPRVDPTWQRTAEPRRHPLMVITAGAQARATWEQAWQKMQAELAGLSTCSTHIVADRAGHHGNRDDPVFLVQAPRGMIDKLR